MFRGGYLRLGPWNGASILLHWSIPVAGFVFGGLQWRPGYLLAFTFLVLLHEVGHAAVVRALRLRVVAIEVTGLGGVCRWSGNASPFEESLIAWGGVLAQLLGWGVAALWMKWAGGFESAIAWQFFFVFTTANLRLICVNLLPIEPLDGARAWKIFDGWKSRQSSQVPYGTWRDHSSDAQRDWYDRMNRESQGRRVEAPQPPTVLGPEERPLSAEGRRAIEELMNSTVGQVTARREGEDDSD